MIPMPYVVIKVYNMPVYLNLTFKSSMPADICISFIIEAYNIVSETPHILLWVVSKVQVTWSKDMGAVETEKSMD